MHASENERGLAWSPTEHLVGHSKKVSALSWAPQELKLASGSHDTTIRLWTFDDGGRLRANAQLRSSAAHTSEIESLCWNRAEPNLFASAAADSIKFWDARSDKNEGTLQLPSSLSTILNMSWSVDGTMLAAGTESDELILVDVRKAALEARRTSIIYTKKQDVELNQLAWSGSGLLLLAVGSKTEVDTFSGAVRVMQPRFDPGTVGVVERIAVLPAHSAQVQCLRFNSTFKLFASGGLDASVSIWDAEGLAVLRVLDRFDASVNVLGFSSDSAFLAVGTELERSMDVVGIMLHLFSMLLIILFTSQPHNRYAFVMAPSCVALQLLVLFVLLSGPLKGICLPTLLMTKTCHLSASAARSIPLKILLQLVPVHSKVKLLYGYAYLES